VSRTYYTQDAAQEMRRALDRIREARDARTARAIAAEAVRASKWNGHANGRAALEPVERRVLDAFLGYYREAGVPPSRSELARLCGFKTKRSAHVYLGRLHAKGHLVLAPGGRFLPA
jgi:hypothetical protein